MNAAANAVAQPNNPGSTPLYRARIARPLGKPFARPNRLGYSTVAWCERHDLIAVVSGCGGVSVFHADSPGEYTMLVSQKQAPARHVVWRPAANGRRPVLVVVDAAGRITFWVSDYDRVNVWKVEYSVEVDASVVGIGWTKGGGAVAAVLSNGSLSVWLYPDAPLRGEARRQLRPLVGKSNKLDSIFGGEVKCAHLAPGERNVGTVAIVTVLAADPTKLHVCHVSLSSTDCMSVETKPFGIANLQQDRDGKCLACFIVPPLGSLYAVGDQGTVGRWLYHQRNPGAEAVWSLQGSSEIYSSDEQMNGRKDKSKFLPREIHACAVSHRGSRVVTAGEDGIKVYDGHTMKLIADFGDFSPPPKPAATQSPNGASPTTGDSTMASLMEPLPGDGIRKIKPQESEGSATKPNFWGIGLSPLSCVAMALTSSGTIFALPLPFETPLVNPRPGETASQLTDQLIDVTTEDGLRGGWDLLSSVIRRGRSHAQEVIRSLSMSSKVKESVSREKLENLRLSVLSLVDPSTFIVSNSIRLLNAAMLAIRLTAPDLIEKRQLNQEAEANQMISREHILHSIAVLIRSNLRLGASAFSATPLVNWILVFGVLWLRTYARYLVAEGENVGPLWSAVVDADNASSRPVTEGLAAIITSSRLAKMLRIAGHAACLLLGINKSRQDAEAEGGYCCIKKDDAYNVVAAICDVSLSGETNEDASKMTSSAYPKTKRTAAAAALLRHQVVARALGTNSKLTTKEAERALGISGGKKGAGWLLSKARKAWAKMRPKVDANIKTSAANNAVDNAEGPHYDLVTGRPLPPWTPLRRCVISGLFAAETTRAHGEYKVGANDKAPWAERWAFKSPFGGLWARVPSLDLGRYDLLAYVPSESVPRYQPHRGGGSRPPSMPNSRSAHVQLPQNHVGTSLAGQHRVKAGPLMTGSVPSPTPMLNPALSPTASTISGTIGVGGPPQVVGIGPTGVSLAKNSPLLRDKASPLGASLDPLSPSLVNLPPAQAAQVLQTLQGIPGAVGIQNMQALQSPQPGMPENLPNLQAMQALGIPVQNLANMQSPQGAAQIAKTSQAFPDIQRLMNGNFAGIAGGNTLPFAAGVNTFVSDNVARSRPLATPIPQTRPNISTASSTTEAGSVTSRGWKRGSSRGRRRRSSDTRKSSASDSLMNNHDALSTDTRSTMTNTNVADAGITQEISKPRKRRRRQGSTPKVTATTPTALASGADAAAAAAAAAAAVVQGSSAFSMPISTEDLLTNGNLFDGKLSNIELPMDLSLPTSGQLASPTASAVSGRNPGFARTNRAPGTFQTQEATNRPTAAQLQQLPNGFVQQLMSTNPRRTPPISRGLIGAPVNSALSAGPNSGRIVWRGRIQIVAQGNVVLTLNCVATTISNDLRKGITSASEWPVNLVCDMSRTKQLADVKPKLDHPSSEGYVKFTSPNGASGPHEQQITNLAHILVSRKMVFEIECEGKNRPGGFLYVLGTGTPHSRFGPFLLGAYTPRQDTAALMNSLIAPPRT